MDNIFINRVKIYNPTNECFHSMFRYHKNYNKKLDFCKIMNQPPKLPNIGAWREKNWGCSSNGLNQVLEADNTLFFETHDGYPLNVFKMYRRNFNLTFFQLFYYYFCYNYFGLIKTFMQNFLHLRMK